MSTEELKNQIIEKQDIVISLYSEYSSGLDTEMWHKIETLKSNIKSLKDKRDKQEEEGDRPKEGVHIVCIGKDNRKDIAAMLAAKGVLPTDQILIVGEDHLKRTSYPELKPSDPFPVKMPIIIEPELLRGDIKDGQTSRRERRARERKK